MDCLGTYLHMPKPNVTRVQSAMQWTASVHTLHMPKPNVTRVQSATQWTASVHTLHMPKPNVTRYTCPNLMQLVFKVLRNGLLRYMLYTCPNLWWKAPLQASSKLPSALKASSPLQAPFNPWSPLQAPFKPLRSPLHLRKAPLKPSVKPPWSPLEALFKPPSSRFEASSSPLKPLEASFKLFWSLPKVKPSWSPRPLEASLKPLKCPWSHLEAFRRWSPLRPSDLRPPLPCARPFKPSWRGLLKGVPRNQPRLCHGILTAQLTLFLSFPVLCLFPLLCSAFSFQGFLSCSSGFLSFLLSLDSEKTEKSQRRPHSALSPALDQKLQWSCTRNAKTFQLVSWISSKLDGCLIRRQYFYSSCRARSRRMLTAEGKTSVGTWHRMEQASRLSLLDMFRSCWD